MMIFRLKLVIVDDTNSKYSFKLLTKQMIIQRNSHWNASTSDSRESQARNMNPKF